MEERVQTYINGQTPIMAEELNAIQDAIIGNSTLIGTQATQISGKAEASALTAETAAREAAVSAEATARAAADTAEATARAAADTALTSELNDVKSAIKSANKITGLDVMSSTDTSTYYISSNGALSNSTSWESHFYIIDKNDVSYLLKAYTNNTSYYNVGFYSSETLSNDAFISGLKLSATDSLENVIIAKNEIPSGTVGILFCTRTASGTGSTMTAYRSTVLSDIDDLSAVKNREILMQWEAGSINGTTGEDTTSAGRFKSVNFLDIRSFYAYKNDLNLQTLLFAYDENKNYLGRMYDGFSLNYYTSADVLAIYPTTKFVRFVFATYTETDVTENTTVYGSQVYYTAKTALDLVQSIKEPQGYSYYGERITFNQNKTVYKELAFSGYGQDGVEQGNYFFGCNANGSVIVRRKDTGAGQKTLTIPNSLTPHCNSAVWGNKYAETDVYPLLYVNAYNATGEPNGRCYVLRMTELNANNVPFNMVLVQTITVGFATGEPWTDGNDIRPYGNFFVDTKHNALWAYTLRDADKVTRFFKFALPDTSVASVTLTESDIIDQFEVPYMQYIQGNSYNDGKVFILSGMGTSSIPGLLNVVDLASRSIVSVVNLNDVGLSIEPEFINIDGEGINLGRTTAYNFTF